LSLTYTTEKGQIGRVGSYLQRWRVSQNPLSTTSDKIRFSLLTLYSAEELAEWRKDQLVPALEHILSNNPTIYSRIPVFDEYYHRRNSPIKRGGFHPRTSSATTGLATINGDGLHQRYSSELKPETES